MQTENGNCCPTIEPRIRSRTTDIFECLPSKPASLVKKAEKCEDRYESVDVWVHGCVELALLSPSGTVPPERRVTQSFIIWIRLLM